MVSMVAVTKEDWTFKEVSTHQYSHGFHQYPARMHPEIARRIIQKYAKNSTDIVLDPFMGSGGVLVESLLNGNNSLGIDLNPFAVLLSKVKTTPINAKNLEETYQEIIRKSKLDSQKNVKYENTPEKLDLKFWYPLDSRKKLPILKNHVFNIQNKNLRNFFMICFSLTTRRASYQKNSIYKTYRMKPEKREDFEPDTFKIFTNICQKNIKNMMDFHSEIESKKANAYPILGDTRNLGNQFSKIPQEILDDGKAHLVVTSPPYGDHGTTVAYGQFSKHLGLWLELKDMEELFAVDSNGLGGKKIKNSTDLESPLLDNIFKKIEKKDKKFPKKTNLSNRAGDVYAFFFDLDTCLEQLSQYLKKGKSHCCFVVGNRTVRREKIPTDEILVELSKKYDFKHIDTIYRTIANKAMAVKNAPENISNYSSDTMNKESIILLKY